MAKGEPLRVRLDPADQSRLAELLLRTGLDGAVIGRAAIRLLYAEVQRRGEAGFIIDELSDQQYERFLKDHSPAIGRAVLNESPPKKKLAA